MSRISMRKSVEDIRPAYVARRLGVHVRDMTPELHDLKREQLIIARLSKQIKNELKDQQKCHKYLKSQTPQQVAYVRQ